MMHWEEQIEETQPPSKWVVMLNILLILLIIFMMSSNFAFLPGVVTAGTLPRLPESKLIQAPKIIVTALLKKSTDKDGKSSRQYIYSYNGAEVSDINALEKTLREALLKNGERTQGGMYDNESRPLILLHADKNMQLDELMRFYALGRQLDVNIFLVTASDKSENSTILPHAQEN